MREIFEVRSLFIASIGEEEDPSVYRVSKPIDFSKVVLLRGDTEGKNQKITTQIGHIREYFSRFKTEVYIENASIDDIENEILEFTKFVAINLSDETQIVIDCNSGQRYLGTIIRKAVQNVVDFAKFFINRDIQIFEAVKSTGAKEVYFVDLRYNKFSLNDSLIKILNVIEDEISEAEIGEFSGIGQSTVSTHLKNLRRLGLITIKGRKRRGLTHRGRLVRELAEIFTKFNESKTTRIES